MLFFNVFAHEVESLSCYDFFDAKFFIKGVTVYIKHSHCSHMFRKTRNVKNVLVNGTEQEGHSAGCLCCTDAENPYEKLIEKK